MYREWKYSCGVSCMCEALLGAVGNSVSGSVVSWWVVECATIAASGVLGTLCSWIVRVGVPVPWVSAMLFQGINRGSLATSDVL